MLTSALYLIQEIELKLLACFLNQKIIKLTLRGNYEDIERIVRTQINDLAFLDMYILELTSLRYNEIFHMYNSLEARIFGLILLKFF